MPLMDFILSFSPMEDCPSVPPQTTYLSEYVLYPVYDWIVQYYPNTWSPNKVTLVGIFSTLLASLLLLTAMPSDTLFEPPYATLIPSSLILHVDTVWRNAAGPTPLYPTMLQPFFSTIFSTSTSLLFLCGVLNVIYCIADNTDGRLARRLRKASSTGEYLDHGLDCVTSLLSTSVTLSILGISFSNIAITVTLIAFCTILSHTLHYEMNRFIWGNQFFSVDEAMVFFCVANWIPILFPQIGMAKVPSAVLNALIPETWIPWMFPLRGVDVALLLYWVSQLYVVADIAVKKWNMLFRLTTMALVFNATLLLSLIPYHSSQIVRQGAGGYALGPFSYVAVWFITMACSCSTLVHVVIHARCAHLTHVDPVALSGVIFVWLIFPSCPVAGMIVSVTWHVTQILFNVWHLRHNKKWSSPKFKVS